MSISNTVKSIQDIMRKDTGVDGDAQRIGQLVWMLFLKIFDDKETEWEAIKDHYQSPIPEPLRWRNWAKNDEGISGDKLKNFIDNELFPALKDLKQQATDENSVEWVIGSLFEDAYNYMKSPQLIHEVLKKIQDGIDFNKSKERHLFGDMYEQILKGLQSAGNAGEFYTPRAVTEFIVNRVDPKLNESVLDPACGTGGFLTCAIEHKRKHYAKTTDDEQRLQNSIHGIEKKPLPHLLATTNMFLHGIEIPAQIKHKNTLAKPYIDWKPEIDVVITNPPFGGKEEDEIGNNYPKAWQTRETADLFMVLIMRLLKESGRAAVVLPDGFLFGEGIKSKIKEQLLTKCNLHTIVRLPNGVFSPYTGIKTNLLFFSKGKPTTTIWFYEHPYPDGVKSYNKTKPMRFAEFEPEIAWWGDEADGFSARVENEQAWKLDFAALKADAESRAKPHQKQAEMLKNLASGISGKIKDLPADTPAENIAQLKQQLDNLNQQAKEQQQAADAIINAIFNLDLKNPHQVEEFSHEPDVLLSQYATQQQEIESLRQQLKNILNQALSV